MGEPQSCRIGRVESFLGLYGSESGRMSRDVVGSLSTCFFAIVFFSRCV